LNILSIFDGLLKCKAQRWELYPNLFRTVFLLFNRFPAFLRSLLQIPSASADIYINFFVKGFYEELFTLYTWFSTLPVPQKQGILPPLSRREGGGGRLLHDFHTWAQFT
jgi:hypothetical protein